ncbi:2'-5' RNA ligase family protein [Xanthomonas vesicatoria]|nr:hypothetical protein [Xanthomonas vesicatoria]MCC8560148.1 hypothetical protein [Xanthomonas vesicatoria]MCC8597874.1 hypothetical protein [Xanthomonas vesicatoria]MCC8601078.1 hypothetical protein [Xanthomonas vesicatoria]MCC8608297.1 hypothetical protein [Xanthomonas vesicatoria]MCC8616532.1 hypothetical protein [Xanthomonas vesicatoria]
MLKPPPEVRDLMSGAVAAHGFDTALGERLFDVCNWHQSLSDRYEGMDARAAMLRAGGRVDAAAVTLRLNRITTSGSGPLHCAFRAYGVPLEFTALLQAVATALQAEQLAPGGRHTPHITISYKAPAKLDARIPVIVWHSETLLLVEAGGVPYRYTTIAQWPLRPAAGLGEQGQGLLPF